MSGALLAAFQNLRSFGVSVTVPDAPTIGSAARTASGTVGVAFTAPVSDGGAVITQYRAISTPGSITGVLNQAGSGTISVSGLTNGTGYTFTVRATNSVGDSAESFASNSATPYTAPDAPTIGAAFAITTTTATVEFTAPGSNGGADITSYTATPSSGGGTGTLNQAGSGTITVTGLTADTTYTFVVRATNAGGNSANSASSASVLTTIDELWGWGKGTDGQFGNSLANNSMNPIQAGALTTWSSARATTRHTLALSRSNALFSAGNDQWGTLGQNTYGVNRSSWTQIGSQTNWSKTSSSFWHNLAIKTDGTLWSWGLAGAGLLGHGDLVYRSSPTQIGTLTSWAMAAAGRSHSSAIRNDGTLWSWGTGGLGRLGNTSIVLRSSPVQVGTLTTWSKIAVSMTNGAAVKTDGTLWSWGAGGSGGRGNNTATTHSSPVQLGVLTTWSTVVGSQSYVQMCGLRTDGTLWAWGSNAAGELGVGNVIVRSSPTQVGSSTAWASMELGNGGASARRTDSTVWTWGKNSYYANASNAGTSAPVQVGALSVWKTVGRQGYTTMLTRSR